MIIRALLLTLLLASPSFAQSACVSWTDNSTNETSFLIQRKNQAATDWVNAGSTGANSTSFCDSQEISDTKYRVVSRTSSAHGTPSNEATYTNGELPIITIAKTGSGTGLVKTTNGALHCGDFCTVRAKIGTSFTFQQTANIDSQFTGWSGDCSGTGTCIITVTGDMEVGATFNLYANPPAAASEATAY